MLSVHGYGAISNWCSPLNPMGGGGGGGGAPPPGPAGGGGGGAPPGPAGGGGGGAPGPAGGGGGGGGAPESPTGGGGAGAGAGGGGAGGELKESPRTRPCEPCLFMGFCGMWGEGRDGLLETLGPVSFLGMAGAELSEGEGEGRGRVEANLLPVALSFTSPGLKPNNPPPPPPPLLGAGLGFSLGGVVVARGKVVDLTPPMGGGGGGGGAPVENRDCCKRNILCSGTYQLTETLSVY